MNNDPHAPRPFARLRWAIVLSALGAIGLLFLLSEHRVHLLGALPYLLLLSCPLMHLFMRHGHRHGQAGKKENPSDSGGSHEQHR